METIEIYNHTIRLSADEGTRLKPVLFDICDAVGLNHLVNHDQIKGLLELLVSGKYKQALQVTCYGSDLNISGAKLRLIRFLIIGLGCLLVLNDDLSANKAIFNQHRDFVNGIFGFQFNNDQILNLVKAELPDYILNIDLE